MEIVYAFIQARGIELLLHLSDLVYLVLKSAEISVRENFAKLKMTSIGDTSLRKK